MTTYPSFDEISTLLRSLRPFLLDPASAGEITAKNRNDFVTAADLGVQRRLQSTLGQLYPSFRFMGEEDSDHTVSAEAPTFILDPIDGTTNYIFSYGLSAVSLALVHRGKAEMGAVYNPHTDELFFASRKGGATLNGKTIGVLRATAPAEVIAAVGTMPYHKEHADGLFAVARRLYEDCIDIRRSGSAALDICYVATGRVGLYCEKGLKVWDYAAASLILEEAGGRITDYSGGAIPYCGGCDIAASNGPLHPYLLNLLREHA